MKRYLLLLLGVIGGVIGTIRAADADAKVDVPDPFGLGERLALVDYLRDHKIAFPSANDLPELRRLYRQTTQPKVDPALVEEEKRKARESERLRQDLVSRFGIQAPESADIPALKGLIAKHEADQQDKERTRLIGILEQQFGITTSPDSSFEAVRLTYANAVRDAQDVARKRREESESRQPRPETPALAQRRSDAETPPKAKADSDAASKNTDEPAKTKPTASEQPEIPKLISLPTSTHRYWDNYSSAPSKLSDGIRVTVFMCDNNEKTDIPTEDRWALPNSRGYYVFATSGWSVDKTVVIEVEDRHISVTVKPSGASPITNQFLGAGKDKIPSIKIISVK